MILRNFFFALLAAVALLSSVVSQALPIVEDDAFTAGDNKAVRQTSTGLVWMDFGVNNDRSFNQVIDELGSTYKGWRLAKESEVRNLYGELFSDAEFHVHFDTIDYWRGINIPEVMSVFGFDHSYSYRGFDGINGFDSDDVYGTGLFITDTNNLTHATMQYQEYLNSNGLSTYSYALIGYSYFEIADLADEVLGISTFLVKESTVPEPTSILLMGLGLLGLGAVRRRATK